MKFSMFRRTSVPLDIIPLKRNEFQARTKARSLWRHTEPPLIRPHASSQRRGIYWRQQDPKQSTEFTYCRFLVPYLNNYKGEPDQPPFCYPRAPRSAPASEVGLWHPSPTRIPTFLSLQGGPCS